jgi:phosphonate transport system substrate-binding protein
MLGAGGYLPALLAGSDAGAPVRLAISESLVADVNLNDARAAMLIWLKQMSLDLKLVIEFKATVFDTTDEILRRARAGSLDCVALNIVEYRQITEALDPSQVVTEAGDAGLEQYFLIVKRNSGIRQLGDLRGRRLVTFKSPKMCVSAAWVATILEEAHLGAREQFFGSENFENKPSRVVLPVFFGQADACLTSKRGFDTMCELNPQVGKDLIAIASSPPMVVSFYVFHRNYHSPNREKFVNVLSRLRNSPAGRQLATLFQFGELTLTNSSCLANGLKILDLAERIHTRTGASQK